MLSENKGKFLLFGVGAALFTAYAVSKLGKREDTTVTEDAEYLLEQKSPIETVEELRRNYPQALHLLAESYRRLDEGDAVNRTHIMGNRLARRSLVHIIEERAEFLSAQIVAKTLSEAELLDFLTGDINHVMSVLSKNDGGPWSEALRLPGVDLVKIIQLAKSDAPVFEVLMRNGLNEEISKILSPSARPATNGATTGLFAKPGIPVEVAEIVGQNLSAVEGQVLRAVNKAANAAADAEIAFNASPTSP